MMIFGKYVRRRTILFALATVLAARLTYGLVDFFSHTGPTPPEVESWIMAELPPHATEPQIYTFLDRHGLAYQTATRRDGGAPILFVSAKERDSSLFRSCTLVMRFDFGNEGLLRSHQVSESCYSL